MKEDFVKTMRFFKAKHFLENDEEFAKDVSDDMFEESMNRKLSFIDSFSRMNSRII